MNDKELFDALDLLIADMDDDEAVELFNEIARHSDPSLVIYPMDQFDDIITYDFAMKPIEIINHLGRKFNTQDKYFIVTEGNDIISFNELYDRESTFDREFTISSIIENADNFGNADVADILDQFYE